MVNESRSARYDTADYLTTAESNQDYLNAALEDGDERVLLRALCHVAEKKGGLSQLSLETGLARDSLPCPQRSTGQPTERVNACTHC